MSKEVNKILKHNHGQKSTPFVIYADLVCLPEKINTFHNDPEKSSTTKINKHTVSGYSLFTCSSFDTKEKKLDCYRGEDSLKKFCKDLKEHITKTINCEKKKMIPLTKKKRKCMISNKFVTYVKKGLVAMITMKSIIK